MKTTIITAALALGLAASGMAASDYTLGDVVYTTTNPAHANHGSDKMSNQTTFTFTLTAGLFDNEATTTQTVASNGAGDYSDTADSKVALTSITLWESGNQNTATIPGTLTITGSDGVSITSTGYTRLNDQRPCGSLHDGGTWTFDFDAANLLTVGTTYTVTFSSWSVAVTNQGASGFAATGGNTTWQPASMSIETASVAAVAVPEPATATLSLLALAGLAARRRRK